MSIKHLNESDGALTDSIKADLQRVVTTVEKVKTASNTIMDGILLYVNLLQKTNMVQISYLMVSTNLLDNNKQLQNHASSSLDMTTDINSQVENVARDSSMRWYLLQLNQVPMPRQVQPTLRVFCKDIQNNVRIIKRC